jgi:predicted flap endonuclease-1-like 5' DNA nuclease
MSAARTMFAIIFVLYLGITLVVPSFPPAQLLCGYVGIPQTTSSIWGISIATLLNGIINGFFWTILAITTYGLAQRALHTRKPKSLPPIPARAGTPPGPAIPPTPSSIVRKEPARAMMRAESVPIRVSKEPTVAELDIETIEGIGPAGGALLRNSGIDTVSDLLRVGATERGRQRLADQVGVTSATVLRWVYRGDLLRVRGIGRKYSALLESAGVSTVTDLSTKNPRHLSQTLKAVNRERNLVRRSPPSRTIEIWVNNAKNLEPILVE